MDYVIEGVTLCSLAFGQREVCCSKCFLNGLEDFGGSADGRNHFCAVCENLAHMANDIVSVNLVSDCDGEIGDLQRVPREELFEERKCYEFDFSQQKNDPLHPK